MKKSAFLLLAALLLPFSSLADEPSSQGRSVIVEVKGAASMGDDRSRKETVDLARKDAKRNAAESAATYIRSETSVKDYVVEKDLVEAFSKAVVKVIEEFPGAWTTDPALGECYHVTIKAEVIPYSPSFQKAEELKSWLGDPTAPLTVKAWSDRKTYRAGEKMTVYLTGNKPFFARVVYQDATGRMIQILPNPYRRDNYFEGGTVYSLPSGKDRYDLTVSAPFGTERIRVFASTSPLGDVDTESAGAVFLVKDGEAAVGSKTRGITIGEKSGDAKSGRQGEFFETGIEVTTEK